MTNMNPKDTLTRLVERAVKGGWLSDRLRDYEIETIRRGEECSTTLDLSKWEIHVNFNKYHVDSRIKKRGYEWYAKFAFSLPDLICNADFMRAVFGDEKFCTFWGDVAFFQCIKYTRDKSFCKKCSMLMDKHQFHAQQLIILPPDERLEYLERFLGEE